MIVAIARSATDLRQELDDLKRSGAKRFIYPDLLDASLFPNRMLNTDDADFKILRRLIEEEGQEGAVQVRDHPRAPGRFQIATGIDGGVWRRNRPAVEGGDCAGH